MISPGLALLCTPLRHQGPHPRDLAQVDPRSGRDIVYPRRGERGTPSMGRLAIVAAVDPGLRRGTPAPWTWPTASGLLALYLMGRAVHRGFWPTTTSRCYVARRGGIRARTKLLGQAAVRR